MNADDRRVGGWADLAAEILDTDPSPRDWVSGAICSQTDPDIFFPEVGRPTAAARLVCQGCPVKTACEEWATDAGERFGVWGGINARARGHAKVASPAPKAS